MEPIIKINRDQLQALVPKWYKAVRVETNDEGAVEITLYDKTEDYDIELNLNPDGTFECATGRVYKDKVTTTAELDTAISDYSDDFRGHSDGNWN
jgi:hypothetical protein